jgi:hypothetical protein
MKNVMDSFGLGFQKRAWSFWLTKGPVFLIFTQTKYYKIEEEKR